MSKLAVYTEDVSLVIQQCNKVLGDLLVKKIKAEEKKSKAEEVKKSMKNPH